MTATVAWRMLMFAGGVAAFASAFAFWRVNVSNAGRSPLHAVLGLVSLGLMFFFFVGGSVWHKPIWSERPPTWTVLAALGWPVMIAAMVCGYLIERRAPELRGCARVWSVVAVVVAWAGLAASVGGMIWGIARG
ncbi:hypothetical protein ES703_47562 [subsurface metagenome]